MLIRLTLAVAIASLTVTLAAGQEKEKKPAGSLTDVTGTWVMDLQGHQMALELEQKETMVEGILHAMGRRILLVGDYADRKLTLKGERPEDGFSSHEGANHAGPILATMLDDGTLEGELSTNKGRTKWSGERFKKQE